MKLKIFLTSFFTLFLIFMATSIPSYASEVDLSSTLTDFGIVKENVFSNVLIERNASYTYRFSFGFNNYVYVDDFVMVVALDEVTSTVQFANTYDDTVNFFGRYSVSGFLSIGGTYSTSVFSSSSTTLVRNNNPDGSVPRWTSDSWTPVLRFDVSGLEAGSYITALYIEVTFTNTHDSNTRYTLYNRAKITSLTARSFGALEASQVIGDKIDQATQDILNNQGSSGNASQIIQDQHDSELSMQEYISDIFALLGDVPTVPPLSLDTSLSGSLLLISNTFDSLSSALGFHWNLVWNFLVVIGCLGAILGVTGAVVGLSKSGSSRQSDNQLRSKGGSD